MRGPAHSPAHRTPARQGDSARASGLSVPAPRARRPRRFRRSVRRPGLPARPARRAHPPGLSAGRARPALFRQLPSAHRGQYLDGHPAGLAPGARLRFGQGRHGRMAQGRGRKHGHLRAAPVRFHAPARPAPGSGQSGPHPPEIRRGRRIHPVRTDPRRHAPLSRTPAL